MGFTNFKTLGDVLKHHQIQYKKADFEITAQKEVPATLLDDLDFTFQYIAYNISDAAVRENLIYPILKTAYRLYADFFSLWSHQALELKGKVKGIPDYIVSKLSALGNIVFETPYIAVLEAKKDDFTGGWAQCALEMLTIQAINENLDLKILGIVSNGETWEAAQLQQTTFTMYKQRYDINELKTLYNFILSLFEICKNQFPK